MKIIKTITRKDGAVDYVVRPKETMFCQLIRKYKNGDLTVRMSGVAKKNCPFIVIVS